MHAYRLFLLLLPREFRRDFGADMEALLEERLADAGQARGRRALIWALACADVLRCAPAEWGRALGVAGRRDAQVRSGDGLLREARMAVRSLLRAPGFTALAVLTLALGIGAAVAMFTVVNGTLLRPLPYPEPDRLVRVSPGQNFNLALADAVAAVPGLDASTGISGWGLTLGADPDHPAEQVSAQVVDAGFFEVFGVRPALGRAFRPEERDPDRSGVVILSDAYWRTRFGADPSIVGRRIPLDGYLHTTREAVGVMPRGFEPWHLGNEVPQLWIPLSRAAGRTVPTDSTWYVNYLIGRMGEGTRVDQVAQQVRARTDALVREFPRVLNQRTLERAGAAGLLDSMVGDVRSALTLMLAAVGLVMALACANLANLLLVRGERRRAELALRVALGADRARLVRERMVESGVLAALGGALGVGLARLLVTGLQVSEAAGLPRADPTSLDARVLGFAVLVSGGAALAFGLWPALRATRTELRADLVGGMRLKGRRGRSGFALVAGEMALATVLVIGAGLLLSSLRALRSVDPGLDSSDVAAIELGAPSAYEGARAIAFYDQLLERLRAAPGVRAAGAIHLTPVTLGNWSFPYLADGMEPPEGPLPSANFRVVVPGYFEAVDQPLLRGRMLDDADRAPDAAAVGLVNRTLAERLWPGADPLGRTVRLFGNQPFQVVGVVGDVRQSTLDAEPEPEMYLPHGGAWALPSMTVIVEADRAPGEVAALARALANEVDPGVPVVRARPLAEVIDESMGRRRFFARSLTFFGALALGLGAVGVYGVVATTTAARRAEYGVRMALGAGRPRVLRSALGAGLAPVGVGLAAGLIVAAATTRLLGALLFGVSPRDPLTFLCAAAVLGLAAVAAVLVPAVRVTRVDAATVLRAE